MTVYGKSFALGAGYSRYQVQYSIDKVKELKEEGFFALNKTFLPAKVFYFLFMGSLVSFIPFAPIYMEQLGLNSFQIGIVGSVDPIGTFIASPIWGVVADRYSIHKSSVLVAIVVGGTAMGATYFTPSALNTTTNDSDVTTTTEPPLDWDATAVTFSVMMTLLFVSYTCLTHVIPTVDSNVMRLLEDHPGTDYGKQRLWGSVGWGSFSAITGLSIDIYSRHYPEGNQFLPAYIMFAAMMLPAIIPILTMQFLPHTRPASISRSILGIFRTPSVLVYLFIIIVAGSSLGVISAFQFIFLKSLKAPSIVMGLTLTFTCLSDIPVMYVSGRMIRWLGEEAVTILALFCYAVRLILYSSLENPWLILPIELLHGICFGALYTAMTSFANKISPTGMEATVQNIVSAAFMGVGRGLGTIAGGYVYNRYGPRKLFLYCSILCGATTVFSVVYIILRSLLSRHRRQVVTYNEI